MNTNLQQTNGGAPQTASRKTESDKAIAGVKAQLALAERNPRRPSQAKQNVLTACKRHSFAKDAYFEFYRGGNRVYDGSIELARLIAQKWGNMKTSIKEVERYDGYSDAKAVAWDIQNNNLVEKQFVVEHVRNKGGRTEPLETERDIREKISNYGERFLRKAIKSAVPNDVWTDALDQIEETVAAGKNNRSHSEVIESLVGAFNEFGVTADELSDLIGRDIENAADQDIVRLRGVYNTLREDPDQRNKIFGDAGDDEDEPNSGLAEHYSPDGGNVAGDDGEPEPDEENDKPGPSETQDDAPEETPERDNSGPSETKSSELDSAAPGGNPRKDRSPRNSTSPREKPEPEQTDVESFGYDSESGYDDGAYDDKPDTSSPSPADERAAATANARGEQAGDTPNPESSGESPSPDEGAITPVEAEKKLYQTLQDELDINSDGARQVMDWLAYQSSEVPLWGKLGDDEKVAIAMKVDSSSTKNVVRRRLESVLGDIWEPILGLSDFSEVDKSTDNMVKKAKTYHKFLKELA